MADVYTKRSSDKLYEDVFVTLDRKEAAVLITSLSRQLNDGTHLELVIDSKGGRKGTLAIFVREMRCFSCQAEIRPYTGMKVRGVIVCKKCYRERYCHYCRGFGNHVKGCSELPKRCKHSPMKHKLFGKICKECGVTLK